jgi:hypothetical protein
MRKIVIFILIAIVAFAVFTVLSYFEETFLGAMLALIMLCWPAIFWLMSKLLENHQFGKKNDDSINQDIFGEPGGKLTATKSEEFEEFRRNNDNVIKAKEELGRLKMSLDLLNEEKNEGVLSEEVYNELKKQNEESIEKLEEEISKASGKAEGRKVWCKKGKHYISIDDCLPSKIDGYVICQEHNEEIRVE